MMKLIRQLWHRSSALTVPINKKQTAIALTAYCNFFLSSVINFLPCFAVTNCDCKHFSFHVCGAKNPPQNSCNHFHSPEKMDYSLSFSSLILS